MIIYVLVIGLSGVCSHTSDEQIGLPLRSRPTLSRIMKGPIVHDNVPDLEDESVCYSND